MITARELRDEMDRAFLKGITIPRARTRLGRLWQWIVYA